MTGSDVGTWLGLAVTLGAEIAVLIVFFMKFKNDVITKLDTLARDQKIHLDRIIEGHRDQMDDIKKDHHRDHSEVTGSLNKVEEKMTREHQEERRNVDGKMAEIKEDVVEEQKEGFSRLEEQLKEQREDRKETNDLLRQVVHCLQESKARDEKTHLLVEQQHRRIVNGSSTKK